MNPLFIKFSDHTVPYRVFIKDVAAQLAYNIRQDREDPEYISQNQAYKMFGRRLVERWRNSGRVNPVRRLQKLLYRTADLRLLERLPE